MGIRLRIIVVNNVLNSGSNLITAHAQPLTDKSHALTTELKGIAPQIADELLSQFSEEKVEQLLQQQLSSLLTVSSQTKVSKYQNSNEEIALQTIISSQQEGLNNNENSDKLMTRLNKSVKDIQTAYANTSDILSSLGQLGHEQKSFLASSEQQVEQALAPHKEKIRGLNNKDNDVYRFELSVKTKEGDIINVTFNSSQDDNHAGTYAASGFSLNYQVEGDLSEAEHQALTEVLSGVGEMADEFFKLGHDLHSKYANASQSEIDLGFLANINYQQLSDFELSLSTDDGRISGPYSERTLDLSYQFDHHSKQQTLDFESNAGVEKIDFSLNMSTFGGTDVKSMQQYLATLDQSLEDNRENSKSESDNSPFGKQGDLNMLQGFALFKGAFKGMSSAAQRYTHIESVALEKFTDGREMVANLVDNMITNDPRYQGLGEETKNTLGAGISKLADFDAKFSFSQNPEGLSLRPKSTVELNQKTELIESGALSGITQNKSVATHFDYQLTRPDYYDKKESYNINTAIEDKELVGLDQDHQKDVDQKQYRFSPTTNQYELMMARTEAVTNKSNIRLINDIWLETNENSQTMDKKERVGNSGKRKPEDFENTNHHSHQKLVTLIGDLDKLANNKNFKREYLTELDKVNFFMNKFTE